MNRTFIRIIIALLICVFAFSALAPAFAADRSVDDRTVVTVDGDAGKGEALITREYVGNGSGTRLVVEDIVYIDGHRVRTEYRPGDGTLARREEFVKQQLVGGRINWRPTLVVEYGADGVTVVSVQIFVFQ